MGSSPAPAPAPVASDRWRWGVVWLLFLATMLNYMDRQALNQTSSFLLAEFQVPEAERETAYKTIENRFAYSFAFFQVVAGFFADRVSLRRLYLAALVVWSAAGFLTGLVPPGALWALMLCRVVLGFGEAFNWPCAVGTVRRVVPRESRGLANGIFHSGASIGAIATPLLVLAVVDRPTGAGWRTVFLVVGAAGLAWAVLWMVATRGAVGRVIDTPPPLDEAAEGSAGADVRLGAVFALRRFWLMLAVGCAVNVTWHFFRTWFVRYLGKDLHQDAADIQWLTMGFFVAADLGSLLSGTAIRWLTRAGFTVERSRKLVMTGLAAVCLLAIPATQVPGIGAKMALFYAVAAGAMGGFAVYFALSQDVAARHTAQMIGIGGSTAWVLIALTNEVVGPLADRQGTFVPAILAVAFVPLIAAAAGWLWPEPKRR